MEMKMIDCPAPVAAQHSGRMGIVDHHDGAIFFRHFNQSRKGADVALHRENTICNQKLAAGNRSQFLEYPARRRCVFVGEDVNLGFRQPAAIDNAGVVQLVGNDVIFGGEDRGNRAGVGGESGLKYHAGFDVLEARDALLQLHVQRHGAGDGPDGARSRAVFPGGLDRRFNQLGVSRQPEVVVRSEIDDLAAIETRFGGARRFQHTQALVRARLPPRVQLRAEIRQRIGQRQTFSGTTNGARYGRVNIAVASLSPLQSKFSESNSTVRPRR